MGHRAVSREEKRRAQGVTGTVPVGNNRQHVAVAADLGLSLSQELLGQPQPDGLPGAVRQHLHCSESDEALVKWSDISIGTRAHFLSLSCPSYWCTAPLWHWQPNNPCNFLPYGFSIPLQKIACLETRMPATPLAPLLLTNKSFSFSCFHGGPEPVHGCGRRRPSARGIRG